MTAKAVTDLPEPDFAHQRHGLALVDAEADMVEHLHGARARAELDREVFDGEGGNGGHVRCP